jgi:hypothetical protein
MKLLNLFYGDVPTSALGKRVSHVDYRISCTICGCYLSLPILEAHSYTAVIDVHKALLLLCLLVYQTRTRFNLIHELADTLTYVLYRLPEKSLYTAFYLGRA